MLTRGQSMKPDGVLQPLMLEKVEKIKVENFFFFTPFFIYVYTVIPIYLIQTLNTVYPNALDNLLMYIFDNKTNINSHLETPSNLNEKYPC